MKHIPKIPDGQGGWIPLNDPIDLTPYEKKGVAARLISEIPVVDKGMQYITVFGKDAPDINGIELEATYNIAKTLNPSIDNEIWIKINPGIYSMDTVLNLDTPYINLIGESNSVAIKGYCASVSADNIKIFGINCADAGLEIMGDYPNLWVENFKGQIQANIDENIKISGKFINIDITFGNAFLGAYECSGYFENFKGYSQIFVSNLLSGTFINCRGGNSSFIGNLSGKIYNSLISSEINLPLLEGGEIHFCIDENGNTVNIPGQNQWENIPTLIIDNGIKHGRLYNWYAVTDPRGLAPVGWHVPSREELTTLYTFCGANSGDKLKEVGTKNWNVDNGNSDIFGFRGLASGITMDGEVYFSAFGDNLILLSTTQSDTLNVYNRSLADSNSSINPHDFIESASANKKFGYSVRYIKDNSINEGDFTDIDGNIYHAITIGTQVWSQQNAATLHYRDGSAIGVDFGGIVGAVVAYNYDESNVYDIVQVEDLTHIQPKDGKKIHASIIDGLTTSIGISKSGVNNSPNPERFRWITDKTITEVLLTLNCSDISIQIGETIYNATTLKGAVLPALTDMIILDVTIQTGYNNANAIIIF